jgi:hypothetical protein
MKSVLQANSLPRGYSQYYGSDVSYMSLTPRMAVSVNNRRNKGRIASLKAGALSSRKRNMQAKENVPTADRSVPTSQPYPRYDTRHVRFPGQTHSAARRGAAPT